MRMIDSWAFRTETLGSVEKSEDDFGITITVPVLLASAIHGFDGAMKRRTFHLPPNLDRALAKHAEVQGKKPSVVVRDALAIYLAIEDTHHRVSIALDALRQEMRAGLLSIQELITRSGAAPQHTSTSTSADRVRARFDLITHKDEAHENGNR
jgi:predicted transcriptional regulator